MTLLTIVESPKKIVRYDNSTHKNIEQNLYERIVKYKNN